MTASTREEWLFVAGGKGELVQSLGRTLESPNPPVPDGQQLPGESPQGKPCPCGPGGAHRISKQQNRSRVERSLDEIPRDVRMNQLQRSMPMWALSGRGTPSRKTHSLVPTYRHRHSLTRQVQILYPKPLGPGGSGIQNFLNVESYKQCLFHLM